MKCPVCYEGEMVAGTREVEYTWRGHTTTLPAIDGEHCTACGEIIMDCQQSNDYWEKVKTFRAAVGHDAQV